jgi:phosphoribosylamine--glycine ligase
VVAASPGYPGPYPKGLPITGLDKIKEAIVFHAGTTQLQTGETVTSGGRVLAVSALGHSLDIALDKAYTDLAHIYFQDMHYRRDIGRSSVNG